MKKCNRCQHSVKDNANFCEICGSSLSQLTSASPSISYVMSARRSLEWSKALLQIGFEPLNVQQRQVLNNLLKNDLSVEYCLGQSDMEIEFGCLIPFQEPFWKTLLKFVSIETKVKTTHIEGFDISGELMYRLGLGLLLITNSRLIAFNFGEEKWQIQFPLAQLESVEYDEKKTTLRLYMQDGSFHEVGLILPSAGLANAFAVFDENSVRAESAKIKIDQSLEKAKNTSMLIVSFFNEIIHGARQVRTQ